LTTQTAPTTPTAAARPTISKRNASSVSITFPGHKPTYLSREDLSMAILAARQNLANGNREYWKTRLKVYREGLALLKGRGDD